MKGLSFLRVGARGGRLRRGMAGSGSAKMPPADDAAASPLARGMVLDLFIAVESAELSSSSSPCFRLSPVEICPTTSTSSSEWELAAGSEKLETSYSSSLSIPISSGVGGRLIISA